MPHRQPAVFLDRDGTLIEERHYLSRPEQVTLLPGVVDGLRRLREAGFKLFLVTNQSGVGRGYFTLADVAAVHAHLATLLAPAGVMFERIYVAPERPDEPSRYRKPSPQALFEARDEFGLDLTRSFVVGDKRLDLECGWNASVKASVLVRTGYGAATEREEPSLAQRAAVVDDLPAAADYIVGSAGALQR
jgi:D-glycero-D-manno-heptose 1,7-bisphosphate phosphatase